MNNDEIKKLIESTDMVALVSPYTKLTKAGANYKGLCPFHKEDTPSFVVSQEKKIARCFGCSKGGNPITFLMDIKHLSFNEACIELAKINNIKLDFSNKYDEQARINKKYYEMNKLAQEVFERCLFNTENGLKALNYLHNRGLDDETIKKFKIGLAPFEGNVLYQILKENNYLELDMVDLNLVKQKKDNYVDVFNNRIMFPIADEKGNIVAFSARYIGDSKTEPKYINTSETKIFKKNNILYNLDKAANAITLNKRVIIYEGFMDVIASTKANLEEAVCSMGTALTFNQIKLLKKYTNNVILNFDTDDAGLNATLRAYEMFKNEGFDVKCLLINDCKDVDEYVNKYGPQAYNNYFKQNIIPYFEYQFLINLKKLNKKDLSSKENVKNNIFSILSRSNSVIVIKEYISRLAKILDINQELLYDEFMKKFRNNNINEPKANNNVEIKKQNYNKIPNIWEYRLIKYATIDKKFALRIDDFLATNNLYFSTDSKISSLWTKLFSEYYKRYAIFDDEKFALLLDEDLSNTYIKVLEELNKDVFSQLKFTNNDFEECLLRLKENSNKYIANYYDKNKTNMSDEQILELLKKQFKVN